MTLLEVLRNQFFWGIDYLKGGYVRRAYNLLDNCESGKWTRVSKETISVFASTRKNNSTLLHGTEVF